MIEIVVILVIFLCCSSSLALLFLPIMNHSILLKSSPSFSDSSSGSLVPKCKLPFINQTQYNSNIGVTNTNMAVTVGEKHTTTCVKVDPQDNKKILATKPSTDCDTNYLYNRDTGSCDRFLKCSNGLKFKNTMCVHPNGLDCPSGYQRIERPYKPEEHPYGTKEEKQIICRGKYSMYTKYMK